MVNITNRICTVNDAVGDDGTGVFATVFLGVGEATTFALSPVSAGNFQATYQGENPPLFWGDPVTHVVNPIALVSSGSTDPTLAPGSTTPLLPKWQSVAPGPDSNPPLRMQYYLALENLLSWIDANPSFYRLSGTVMVNGSPESIALYFFAAGCVNDRDFVLIRVIKNPTTGEAQTHESGIAHGNF